MTEANTFAQEMKMASGQPNAVELMSSIPVNQQG
jgi:hypothetical protein